VIYYYFIFWIILKNNKIIWTMGSCNLLRIHHDVRIAAILVHDARSTADTTVGLPSVEQVLGLEPSDGGSSVGGENAATHGASALVFGVQRSGHSDGGWNTWQTVQVCALVGHGSFVGSFSSSHFYWFRGWVSSVLIVYTLLPENNLICFIFILFLHLVTYFYFITSILLYF
jgi:hypothetical protein